MSVHLYVTMTSDHWAPLLDAIGHVLADEPIQVHHSLNDLRVGPGPDVLPPEVVLIRDDHDLDELQKLAGRLEGRQLVLVLHNADSASLGKAHALRPRVLFSQPVAFEEVAAVVAKMVANRRSAPRPV